VVPKGVRQHDRYAHLLSPGKGRAIILATWLFNEIGLRRGVAGLTARANRQVFDIDGDGELKFAAAR
jgi:hypothetical protein